MKMKKGCCINFRNYIREYCKNSSIHGLQYVGEKERTYFERLWWLLIFITCLSGCGYAIYAVYIEWDESPVIINFANSGTQIFTIPFPAVTLCPEAKTDVNKFNLSEIRQKIEQNIDLTPMESTRFQYMSVVCNPFGSYNFGDEYLSDEFYDVLSELKPTFFLEDCHFMEWDFKCEKHFTPVITEEGICYSFNTLDRDVIFRENVVHHNNFHIVNEKSEWTIHNGYKNKEIFTYPFRASLAGSKNGLSFKIVTPRKNIDYACGNFIEGYRMVFHTPATIPWPSQKFIRIPLHQSVVVSLHPTSVSTSKRIELYSSNVRKCYLEDERKLKYFKDYTFSNCKSECLTNFTLQICDCVAYFMPRENGTKICGTTNGKCLAYASRLMQLNHVATKLNDSWTANITKDVLATFQINQCICLPTCSDLNYKTETTQTDWNWKEWLSNRNELNNESSAATVNLFFPTDDFFSSERNELYGPLDFLANFGGLLGLFTGFSILSLMEILYFLTIRIICNIHLFGRWAGQEK